MQISKTVFLVFCLTLLSVGSRAGTVTINVQDFSFIPSNVSVTVGDTVQWQWINGNHTTTSTIIPFPCCNQSWDQPINSSNPTFRYVVGLPGTYNYICTMHNNMSGSFIANPIGIINIETELPSKFSLYQNYPNPFNPVTKVRFDIPKLSHVRLTVYNMLGKEVAVLADQELPGGRYEAQWDAENLASGAYFYELVTADFRSAKRMILSK